MLVMKGLSSTDWITPFLIQQIVPCFSHKTLSVRGTDVIQVNGERFHPTLNVPIRNGFQLGKKSNTRKSRSLTMRPLTQHMVELPG